MPSSTKSQERSTGRSFWAQLESDIDQIGKRAKSKIQFGGSIRNAVPIKIFNSQPLPAPSNESMNSIREKIHKQKEVQISIKNRAHYLNVSKQRRVQTAQLARQKYERVIEIRSKSFRDKTESKNHRQSFYEKYMKQVVSKVTKVKSEKNSQASLQRMREAAYQEAEKVRRMSMDNEKKIKLENKKSVEINKRKVCKTQLEEDKSRKKLENLRKKIQERGRLNHSLKKTQEYSILQIQSSKNRQLLYKVQGRLEKIKVEKQKAEKDLKQYESFLKIGRSYMSPRLRTKSQDSFYLTGY